MTSPSRTVAPEPGDVLVSKRSAAVVYEVSSIPDRPRLMVASYQGAVTLARTLAARQRVRAWYTEDHTHFRHLAWPGDSAGQPAEGDVGHATEGA